MGSALANAKANLGLPVQGNPWYMVGHGDYLTSHKPQNPYEPGIYMPLTSHDLGQHQPSRALLGHIHVRQTYQQVHYPGSPCGLDITETGRRYFTLLYPESNTLTAQPVNTAVIYLNETLITLPLPHEEAYVRQQIATLKEKWDLSPDEWSRAILRLQVRGYTRDLHQLESVIREELTGIQWEAGSPDLTGVATQADPQKMELVQQMQQKVHNEQETLRQIGIAPDDVLEKALHQILNPQNL